MDERRQSRKPNNSFHLYYIQEDANSSKVRENREQAERLGHKGRQQTFGENRYVNKPKSSLSGAHITFLTTLCTVYCTSGIPQ